MCLQNKSLPPAKSWNTGQKIIKSCEFCSDEKPIITIPFFQHQKIDALTESMENTEWLGYLVGAEVQPNLFVVANILVPKQEVTAAHVDVLEPSKDRQIIGTVHSHHSMGSFFSGTDEEFIGANHCVTVVYSKDGYKGMVKRELPCGLAAQLDATVSVVFPANPGIDKFVDEAKKNIQKYVYVSAAYNQYLDGYEEYGYHNESGGVLTRFCATCHKATPLSKSVWIDGVLFCDECANKKRTGV